MTTIIEGKFGLGYRQSPYLFNNFGFKAEVAEGNSLGNVTARSSYIRFFDNGYIVPKKKYRIVRKNPLTEEEIKRISTERSRIRKVNREGLATRRGFRNNYEYQKWLSKATFDEILQARIDEKTDKSGTGGCHIWKGAKSGDGYAVINIEGVNVYVHRLLYEKYKGKIPDGMIIRHKCNNPPCVNVEHIEVGTYKQNTEDMISAGRQLKGKDLPQTKLKEGTENEIRKDYNDGGMTYSQLREKYSISLAHISRIIRNEYYVDNDYERKRTTTRSNAGEGNPRCIKTDKEVEEIRRRVKEGEKQKDIAKEFGISRAQVCRIVNNKERIPKKEE